MKKIMLCIMLIGSVFCSQVSPILASTTDTNIDHVVEESDPSPRWWGPTTSGWLTATDGKSRARINYGWEDINRIISIDGVAELVSTVGGTVTNVHLASGTRITSNTTAIIYVSYYDSVLGNKIGIYNLSL